MQSNKNPLVYYWFVSQSCSSIIQDSQTRLLPLSGLFAGVFLSFYSTVSTESLFKEKVVKSYQCLLKDLLLRLHIFFLELNLTRPNQKVFLSSGPEPSSQLLSPTCTKHLSWQASGSQYLPVRSSHYPSQPRPYRSPGKKAQ